MQATENGENVKGVRSLYADGSLPEGYTIKDGAVLNSKGKEVWGTYVTGKDGLGDVCICKNIFLSGQRLYIAMGHEYIHAAQFYAGLSLEGNASEYAATEWTKQQTKYFGITSFKFESLSIDYYFPKYDYKRFLINPLYKYR